MFLLLFATQISFGQEVGAIIKIADNHYKNESYFKAASFYLKALETQPGNITALYRLAESYRYITNFHSAEYYYEQVIQKSEDRFPLTRYYYALTQKANGKYEEALNNFQSFIANVKAGRYQRLRANMAEVFSEQARIEREGCLLALKELSKPIQDHSFAILAEPVNSVYNDYAPYVYHHDSTIVITSARQESKGGNFDDKFGESLTDLFRFELGDNGWRNGSSADRFERVVNSKFHDGSGVFNQDFSSFYFSHCDESGCKIYVTKNIDGKWVEAVPLNNNINPPRSDSRHPSLTPRGDTLFFVSNRPGGLGDDDIWMSIAARENSWGPPKNLGDHINTAFKESSPFYDSKGKALFFASDGHKGHGGLDIFMAEKIFNSNTELYNMGLPYNSSRHDAFFVFGENIGFLASNREGGIGKMDIYSFEIESDEEIIAEILNFKEVAGRNSLFSSDYEFDNTDRPKIDEIISHQVASRLHGVNVSLTDDELVFFNNLSEADKGRIERIVNTRLKSISSSNIIAVRHEDEFFYQQLSSDFKYHVDKMVTLYLEDYEVAPAVSIEQDDKAFYESLNVNSKEKVDRFIALKLDEYEDLDLNDQYYSSLNDADQQIVDDISVNYLRNKSNLDNLNLPQEDVDFFSNLNDVERAQTELSIATQVASISSRPEFDLGDGEQIFYRNLTGNEKTSLDNIAEAYIGASVDNLESFLDPTDLAVYNNLTPVQKESFDKILAKRIQNFIKADKYTLDASDERDLYRITELQLAGDASALSVLQDDEIADDSPLKLLAEEDADRFNRLLSSASNLVMMNTSSKLKEVALSVEREQDIEGILTDSKPQLASSLPPNEQAFYNGLSPEETAMFDEVLTRQLTQYADSNESFISNNYTQNPNLVPRLQQRLTNDFDLESLVAEQGNDQFNELVANMSPEQRDQMSASLASAAEYMVVNNGPQFQEMATRSTLSPQFIARVNAADNPALQLASRPPPVSTAGLNNARLADIPAAQVVASSKPLIESSLTPNQRQVYDNLSPADKQFIDQALTVKLQEYVDGNDPILDMSSNTDAGQAQAFENKLTNDLTLDNLQARNGLQPTASINTKPTSEKSVISDLLSDAAQVVISNNGSQLRNLAGGSLARSQTAGVTSFDGNVASASTVPATQLIESSKPLYASSLPSDQLAAYNDLTPEERQFFDQAIAAQVQQYMNSGDQIMNLSSSSPQQEQAYEAQLARDLNMNSLESNPNGRIPTSLRNKSAGEKALLSGLLASAAKVAISNRPPGPGNLPSLSGPSIATSGPTNSLSGANPNAYGTATPSAAAMVQSSKPILTNNLPNDQRSVYNRLSPSDRQFVDQTVANQIQGYIDSGDPVMGLSSASPQQSQILEAKIARDLSLNRLESDPNIEVSSSISNRPDSEKAALSRLLANTAKTAILNKPSQPSLTASSSGTSFNQPNVGQSFSSSSPSAPATQLVQSSKPLNASSLPSNQMEAYNNLSAADKQFVDQAVSAQIQGYIDTNDEILNISKALPRQRESMEYKLAQDLSLRNIAANPNNGITNSIRNKSPREQALLSAYMANSALVALENSGPQINGGAPSRNNLAFNSTVSSNGGYSSPTSNSTVPARSGLSTQSIRSGESGVARLIENSRRAYTDDLNGSQRNTFNQLSLEEKQFIDESLSGVISSYVTNNSKILDLVESSDPQYQEIIEAKLASDLSVNKLAANGSYPPPASLTNRSPSFRSNLSATMASMAKTVLTDRIKDLKGLSSGSGSNALVASNRNNVSSPGFSNDPVPSPSQFSGPTSGSASVNSTSPTYTGPVAAFDVLVSSSINQLGTNLKGNSLKAYQSISPEEKKLFEAVLEERLLNTYKQSPQTFNAFASNNEVAIQNGLSVIGQQSRVGQPNGSAHSNVRRALNDLDPYQQSQMSRLLASSMSSILSNDGPQMKASLDRNGVPTLSRSGMTFDIGSSPGSLAASTSGVVPTAAKEPSRRVTSITEDDYNYYYNLDPNKRKMIDKVVALRIVNEFAIDGQHDLTKDKDYLEKLPTREKRSVKRLARFLDGDNMNDIKINIVQEDLNYYDNISNRKKDDINRLIVGEVFPFTGEHNIYGVKGSDQAVLSTLNPREKELFHLLHNIRSQTHNVFGNRLDLDKTILESQSIIEEVKSYDNSEYKNLSISGSLFSIEGGKPMSNFAVSLVDKNGNVVVNTTTTSTGEFGFKNVNANENYTIQSADGDLNTRAKDRYFIKNMAVEGSAHQVIVNPYDEFFLNDDQLPYSVLNSLDDIRNIIAANPNSSIFIKVIDERYEEAMSLNQQIIENLNQRGVSNTSIKYKRELPQESDNPFEGLFKNKVELYVESDQRMNGNNYYSFLVRKDTEVGALSRELDVPEEVLLEENSLTSRSINKNTIIRVWRPLTDPSMDLLVNVSNFSYQEYRVQNGESVITIAEKLRLPEELIMEVNNLTNPELNRGQVIQIYVRK